MADKSRRRTRAVILVLLVAAAVVLGGVGWFVETHHSPAVRARVADGPTLYQAIAAVNASISSNPGGPWGLFSIYGVAAQAPFSPNVIGYPLNNLTVNACQAQFNGLTLWNGTLPVFNGTLNSGTAPFWQFGYFSNTSQQVLLATNILGSVHAYPPMSFEGPCHPWYDLGQDPETWVQQLAPFLADSTHIAGPALTQIGSLSWFYPSGPWAEIYTSGPGVFDGFGDLGGFAGVILDRCGLVGVSDIEPILQWGQNLNGTGGGYSNETHNCAVLNHPYFAGYGSYDWIPGTPGTSVVGGTTQVDIPYQTGITEHNQTAPLIFDAWGLGNWMTRWNLTTSTGQELPSGAPTCGSWVPSVSDCVANYTGWFAVVLSASGGWVDSYGVLPSGATGWTTAVTALVSHQQLVIVVPEAWSLSGDRIAVSSTVPTSTVVGNLTL